MKRRRRACDLYREGYSFRQAAAELGVSHPTIMRDLRAAGLLPRDRLVALRLSDTAVYGASNPAAKLTQDDVDEIRILHDEGGLSGHRIGELYDVAPGTALAAAERRSWPDS